jgi:DNA-binding CsgD family transcriptional regulator
VSAGSFNSVVDAVEAGYAHVDGDPIAWVREVGTALRPLLDDGQGLMGWCYDASDLDNLELHSIAAMDVDERLLPAIARATADRRSTKSMLRSHYLNPAGPLLNSIGPESAVYETVWQEHVGNLGIGDLLCLNAMNFGFHGCSFSSPRRERVCADVVRDALLARVVAHLISAYRLLRASASHRALQVEAVLNANGGVEHAEGEARGAEARAALGRAVQSAELARGRMRRAAPVEALDLWKSMVAGRWTLTDQFERDGKRFVVARINEPATVSVKSLTRRESQVVAMASVGHSNKLIAYELGVSEGTVAKLLARAQTKYGAKSVHELVAAALPAWVATRT